MELNEIVTKKDIENLKEWFSRFLSEHIKEVGLSSNTSIVSNNKNCISVNEAADLLGIAVSTLRNKMCRGEVPFYKPEGSTPYFDVLELERYMKSNKRYSHHEIVVEANTYILKKKLKDKKY